MYKNPWQIKNKRKILSPPGPGGAAPGGPLGGPPGEGAPGGPLGGPAIAIVMFEAGEGACWWVVRFEGCHPLPLVDQAGEAGKKRKEGHNAARLLTSRAGGASRWTSGGA